MKVDGSMAKVSQKIEGKGPDRGLASSKNGRTGGFAGGSTPAPVQTTQSLAVQGQMALSVS